MKDFQCLTPRTKLLYVTPKQCTTSTFHRRLDQLVKYAKLALFMVDQAHCVPQWGHDFRPDYNKLDYLRERTEERIAWVALAATASTKVVEDITRTLSPEGLPRPSNSLILDRT